MTKRPPENTGGRPLGNPGLHYAFLTGERIRDPASVSLGAKKPLHTGTAIKNHPASRVGVIVITQHYRFF